MVAYIGHDKNYWYSCLDCDADYRIADFVPYWDELFDNYCGLAAPGDSGTQAKPGPPVSGLATPAKQ